MKVLYCQMIQKDQVSNKESRQGQKSTGQKTTSLIEKVKAKYSLKKAENVFTIKNPTVTTTTKLSNFEKAFIKGEEVVKN